MNIFIPAELLIFFTAGSFISKAQQESDTVNKIVAEKLNEYLVSANSVYKFNGAVLVAQKVKILLQKGYGFKIKSLFEKGQNVCKVRGKWNQTNSSINSTACTISLCHMMAKQIRAKAVIRILFCNK
jgi:hypothetical protein